MKLTELKNAEAFRQELDRVRETLQLVRSQKPMAVMIGDKEMRLTGAFTSELRGRIDEGLAARETELIAALAKLGVEV